MSSIDEPLYNLYERNMSALLDLAENHVAFANKIFGEQVFTEDEGFADRYFRIGRIQVRAKITNVNVLDLTICTLGDIRILRVFGVGRGEKLHSAPGRLPKVFRPLRP